MISKCTKFDIRSTLQIVFIVYILKCLYVIICSEFYTTLNDNYISLSFCNTLSFSATISVVILDRVFEFYEGNITIVYPNFMNGLYLNVNNFCYVFFGEGAGVRCTQCLWTPSYFTCPYPVVPYLIFAVNWLRIAEVSGGVHTVSTACFCYQGWLRGCNKGWDHLRICFSGSAVA